MSDRGAPEHGSAARPRSALVLHGPNLNLLGTREPSVYGTATLADIDASLVARGRELGLTVECAQSNHEGELIDRLHAARGVHGGVIINPGGYTHTSVAIHDAIRAIELPVIEVHLSNTSAREEFRRRSITGAACVGRVEGFGRDGYVMALEQLARMLLAPP
jgi:3-dehydroquinate dehydratase-2